MVTLPKEVVKEENIMNDQLIEIEIKKPKRDFFGALRGIGKFTEEDKFTGQLEEN